MGDLAPKLSWAEVLRGSGVSTPGDLPLDVRANIERMSRDMFTPLRMQFNAPLIVISGYRTEAVNRACGGARNSQHVQGLALDLVPASKVPSDYSRLAFLVDVLQGAGKIPKGGRGLYKTAAGLWRFVHCDARGTIARWNSGRVDRLEVA